MTVNSNRQFATSLAAFFVTTTLLFANVPAERPDTGLQLQRSGFAQAPEGEGSRS